MKVAVPNTPVRVPGFQFAGIRAGLKESGKRDVALIYAESPATAAATFTTNRVQAAPVLVGMERVPHGRLQAIVINSGNANAYTGYDGLAVARDMCAVAAHELGIDEHLVIPSSTGRIGVPLPQEQVRRGVQQVCTALSPDGFHDALEGIMTTDAFPKYVTEQVDVDGTPVTIAAMAKGAGMIAPKMRIATAASRPTGHATTLAYVMTDAVVSAAVLRRVLRDAIDQSFNIAVVDGDTSTNDTVVLLANGRAQNRTVRVGTPAYDAFADAITRMLQTLARMLVKDGEGGTKVIDVYVKGARSGRDAARVADTIVRSPLCKTAFYGGDPYAGRIVCAAGYSGAVFDPQQMDVFLGEVQIVERGVEVVTRVEHAAAAVAQQPEFALTIDLHAGTGTAYRMTSDLSVAYVRFNSDYRT